MSQWREQTVIGARKIDIDRFDIARPSRNDMQIPDRQVREDIALEAKIDLQMLAGCIMQCDLPPETEQKRTVKD